MLSYLTKSFLNATTSNTDDVLSVSDLSPRLTYKSALLGICCLITKAPLTHSRSCDDFRIPLGDSKESRGFDFFFFLVPSCQGRRWLSGAMTYYLDSSPFGVS